MKIKGFIYGLISSATFGLIPLFSTVYNYHYTEKSHQPELYRFSRWDSIIPKVKKCTN